MKKKIYILIDKDANGNIRGIFGAYSDITIAERDKSMANTFNVGGMEFDVVEIDHVDAE